MERTMIPLSNAEVLSVLRARKSPCNDITTQFFKYLEEITTENVYDMNKLREIKHSTQLEANILDLIYLSNTNDFGKISVFEQTKIKQQLNN